MITTPVIEQYNRIDLPDQAPGPIQPPPEIEDRFITIDAEGKYQWGKDSVSKGELEGRLDAIAESAGEQPTIHIRGGPESAVSRRSSIGQYAQGTQPDQAEPRYKVGLAGQNAS